MIYVVKICINCGEIDGYSLEKERKILAEERRQLNSLLGKLSKSGENHRKSGKYI